MPYVLVVSDRPAVAAVIERCAASVGAETQVVDVSVSQGSWDAFEGAVAVSWRDAAAVVIDVPYLPDSPMWGESPWSRRHDHLIVVAEDPQRAWPLAIALGSSALVTPRDEDQILVALGSAVDGRSDAAVITVMGAAGGVGASTFAAALALNASARSWRSVLVDADPVGGGLDLLVGAEDESGPRWPDIRVSNGHVAADALASSLPVVDHVSLLSHGRNVEWPRSVAPVVNGLRRAFDLIVCDVARHGWLTGESRSAELVARSSSMVLVVPDDVRGIAAARMLVASSPVPVVAVIARRAGLRGINTEQVEELIKAPVLASVPRLRSVAADVSLGLGVGQSRRLRTAAGRVLESMGLAAAS